jgi:glutamate synthase (ferredoxin)
MVSCLDTIQQRGVWHKSHLNLTSSGLGVWWQQVCQGLAQLGLRSLDELVGHADYLQQRDAPLAKTQGLDLSFLTTYAGDSGTSSIRIAQAVHSNGPQLDDEILADKDVQTAIRTQVRQMRSQ